VARTIPDTQLPAQFIPAPLATGPLPHSQAGKLADWHMQERPFRYAPAGAGLRSNNGAGVFNRPIFFRQNVLLAGDRPLWGLRTFGPGLLHVTQNGRYHEQRQVNVPIIRLAALRLGIAAGERQKWLDLFPSWETTFLPGQASYTCADPELGIVLTAEVLAPVDRYGAIVTCTLQQRPAAGAVRLFWAVALGEEELHQFDGIPEQLCAQLTGMAGASAVLEDAAFQRETAVVVAAAHPADTDRVWMGRLGKQQAAVVERTLLPGQDSAVLLAGWGLCDYSRQAVAQSQRQIHDGPGTQHGWGERLRNAWFQTYVSLALDAETRVRRDQAQPELALAAARSYWQARAGKLRVQTPDPAFDAVASFTAGISDYCAQPPAYFHNADADGHVWPYIFSYRQWYANTVIGDHERIEETLRFYATRQQPDGGLTGSDMALRDTWCQTWQPSYVDQLHQHWRWTGDTDLVRDLWPAVQRALDFQQRVLDPNGDGLYIAPSNSEWWGCDFHWKGPKAALASAITWRAFVCAAELAGALGDAEAEHTYRAEAARMRERIFAELWQPARGLLCSVYAGEVRQERPEAMEAYVPIWAGLMDERQAHTMLRFIRDELVVRSSQGNAYMFMNDWWPLVWSHHMVSPGETSEACLAFFKSGDAETGWALLQPVAHSVLRSASPNFQPVMTPNGGQDFLQHDFGMSWGPYIRAVVEGLFGLDAHMPEGRLIVAPNLPAAWQEASIDVADLGYRYQRDATGITLQIRAARPLAVQVALPVRTAVRAVRVDGAPVAYRLEPAVGRCLLRLETPATTQATVRVDLAPEPVQVFYPAEVVAGEPLALQVQAGELLGVTTAQGDVLSYATTGSGATVSLEGTGPTTLFAEVQQQNCRFWEPLDLRLGPPALSAAAGYDASVGVLRWMLRNRTTRPLELTGQCRFLGEEQPFSGQLAAQATLEVRLPLTPGQRAQMRPGCHPLTLTWSAADGRPWVDELTCTCWEPAVWGAASGRLVPVDLREQYNDNAHLALTRRFIYDDGGIDQFSAYTLQDGYDGYEPPPKLDITQLPERLTTGCGVPFLTGGSAGQNALVLANWPPYHFPAGIHWPIDRHLHEVYLLLAAKVVPMKNYVANARVTVTYADGSAETTALIPPHNLDCYYQHFSEQGFPVELGPKPRGILSSSQYARDYNLLHADVVNIPCDPRRQVVSLDVQVLCTECLLEVLGLTLLEAEGAQG